MLSLDPIHLKGVKTIQVNHNTTSAQGLDGLMYGILLKEIAINPPLHGHTGEPPESWSKIWATLIYETGLTNDPRSSR